MVGSMFDASVMNPEDCPVSRRIFSHFEMLEDGQRRRDGCGQLEPRKLLMDDKKKSKNDDEEASYASSDLSDYEPPAPLMHEKEGK
jgi:hypothetical protein